VTNRGLSTAILAFTLFGLILASGCTRRETFRNREGSVTVERKGKKDKVTVRTDKGEAEIETGAALPKNWPSDMPVYRPGKIIGSSSIKGQGDDVSLSLALETSDSVDKVKEFYQSGLPNNAWEISETSTSALEGEEAAVFTAAKEKRSGVITIAKTKDKEKTQLVIQIFTQ
jgi:hypothetical protein